MRNQIFCAITAMAALFIVNGCVKPVDEAPALSLGATEFEVGAEGGTVSVPYELTNAAEGAAVSVEPSGEYDWVNVTSVGKEAIELSVSKNETAEARTAEFTVSYPGISAGSAFVLSQAPGEPAPVYDYDFQLTGFFGSFYEGLGIGGEDNYYLWLSDKPIESADFSFEVGAVYYILDLYAPSGSGYAMPEGTYEVGAEGMTDPMTAGYDNSMFFVRGESEESTVEANFAEGYVEVTSESGVYTIELVLTDDEGKTHHAVYTGPAEFPEPDPDPLPEYIPISDPIDFVATTATANYMADSDGIMGVAFKFTDMDVDEYGYVIVPGEYLQIESYMPLDDSGAIACGTYRIDSSLDSFTMVDTDWDFWGYPCGTYAYHYYADATAALGNIVSGTMEVSEGSAAGSLKISCDFLTAEGLSVKCTYEGALSVAGVPGPDSTLEEDYVLDLSSATATADYYGDYYGTGGGNWMLTIMPESGCGDAVQLDFVADDGGDSSAGIPSGTYTGSGESNPNPGEYLSGYLQLYEFFGSWYVGTNEYGETVSYAPAVSGDLDITNNGDGTYVIEFGFSDGLGHTWSGNWSGAIGFDSGYSAASSLSQEARPGLVNRSSAANELRRELKLHDSVTSLGKKVRSHAE